MSGVQRSFEVESVSSAFGSDPSPCNRQESKDSNAAVDLNDKSISSGSDCGWSMLQGPDGCKGNSNNSKFKKAFSVEEGDMQSYEIKDINR